jgi:hypothetical protein
VVSLKCRRVDHVGSSRLLSLGWDPRPIGELRGPFLDGEKNLAIKRGGPSNCQRASFVSARSSEKSFGPLLKPLFLARTIL